MCTQKFTHILKNACESKFLSIYKVFLFSTAEFSSVVVSILAITTLLSKYAPFSIVFVEGYNYTPYAFGAALRGSEGHIRVF